MKKVPLFLALVVSLCAVVWGLWTMVVGIGCQGGLVFWNPLPYCEQGAGGA